MARKFALLLGVVGISALLLTHTSACSLVVDASAKQCTRDDDCRARGAGFEGSFCSEQNVCVRAVDYCFTNAECIDRTGNEATICRQDTHKCVSLTNKYCKLLADKDDLRDPNAVVFGIHGIPSWSPNTQGCENGIELARRDFKSVQGGLPPTPQTAGKPRPVAWVACDVPIGQQELHKPVSDHLFNDVGVVSSFGPFAQVEFITYGVQAAIKSGSALFHVAEDQKAFELPGREGLIFSMGFPKGVVVVAQSLGVTLMEEVVRRKEGSRPLKLAYVYAGVGVTDVDADQFYEQVRWNGGKSAAENGPTLFKQFSYGDLSDPAFSQKIADLSLQMKDFEPDMVVFRGADEVIQIAQALDRVYPDKTYYLFGIESTIVLPSIVGANESFRKRILGHRPGRFKQDPRVLRADQRYASIFEANGISPLQRACFDLAYTQMFAASAVKDEPLTGRSLGKALTTRFTIDGLEVNSTPSSILPGVAALNAGRNLHYIGTEADQIYDPQSGLCTEWQIQFWCVDPDRNKGDRILDTGNFYTGRTQTFTKVPITCL